MTPERWLHVTDLFAAACQHPHDARDAWVEAATTDPEVRAEVRAMLDAYDTDPDFLETPADGASAALDLTPDGFVGRRFGAYRLVAPIGRGGMGVVYEAVRDDQEFDRRAAVKILPPWSAGLADRFRQERRVLASLDHPGIARLLDSGTTEDGIGFFVMELVDGQPVTTWCTTRRLSIRDRVALVERIGQAVAYAHQHLVVHRDLKPANILVLDDGQPKLLDFGIATVLAEEGGTSLGATRTGHQSFTPEFASPEQVRGERVTTASDIYSLGVLLHLLLTDRHPYPLQGLSPLEAMRVVCDVDPPPPSRVAPERRELAGDLDAIVGKALRKQPADRYATVAELAADLRAWRTGRPVSAAPASVVYRLRRFVGRNRVAVGAAAAATVALVAGGVTTAWQAQVARVERDKAQNRFRQAQEFSRSLLFDVNDGLRSVAGATESRRLLLDRAVQFLDDLAKGAGSDDALAVELAEGYRRLASVQGDQGTDNLGDLEAAGVSLDRAATFIDSARASNAAPLDRLTLALTVHRARADNLQGRGRFDEAQSADGRALELLRELETRRGESASAGRLVAEGYSQAGIFRAVKRDLDGARQMYAQAVRVYSSMPLDVADANLMRGYVLTTKRLGAVELATGALADSERHYRRALEFEDSLIARQPGHPQLLFEKTYTESDLGLALSRLGRIDEAMALWERALVVRKSALEADPKNARKATAVQVSLYRLAAAHRAAGRHRRAVEYQRQTLDATEGVLALGRLPDRVTNLEWARLNLVQDLQALAGSEPTDATVAMAESRALFRRIDPAAVTISGTGEPDATFRTEYDAVAARLSRR